MDKKIFSRDSCCDCPFFKYEDSYGDGYCVLMGMNVRCDSLCNYVYCYEFMDKERALMVLHYYQKWRRGYNGKMLNPTVTGFAIDEAIRCLRKSIKREIQIYEVENSKEGYEL